jgi:hypothetical protein
MENNLSKAFNQSTPMWIKRQTERDTKITELENWLRDHADSPNESIIREKLRLLTQNQITCLE